MNYNPFRMCLGKDGNLSLTRTAACTAHFLFAVTVAWITYRKDEFLLEMWTLYISVAVLHASYDKTAALVANFKNKKLETEFERATDNAPLNSSRARQDLTKGQE
jgi:hypothetical protein